MEMSGGLSKARPPMTWPRIYHRIAEYGPMEILFGRA